MEQNVSVQQGTGEQVQVPAQAPGGTGPPSGGQESMAGPAVGQSNCDCNETAGGGGPDSGSPCQEDNSGQAGAMGSTVAAMAGVPGGGVQGAGGTMEAVASGAGTPQMGSPPGQTPDMGQMGSAAMNPGATGPSGMSPGPAGPTGTNPGATGSVGMNPGASGPTGMNPGQTGATGMNPGQTGFVGMNPGQMGAQPGGNPSADASGAASMMGGAAPYMGPSQMGPFPGQSPGMGQMGSVGMNPGQMGAQPGTYPGAFTQGPTGMMGNGMNPQMGPSMGGPSMQGPGMSPQGAHDSATSGSGCGHMGASAQHIHHDENRYGQVADMVGRFIKGEVTPADMVNGLFSLNFRDDQFWKGAVVGVLTALVLNSDTVKNGLANMFGAKPEEKAESEKKADKKASPDARKTSK